MDQYEIDKENYERALEEQVKKLVEEALYLFTLIQKEFDIDDETFAEYVKTI